MAQTRGEEMLSLRRKRMASAPPFLRGGFRPFFFGGAVWAVMALAIWMTYLSHGAFAPSLFDPLAWHRHEMLFGFVGAVIAGFLLTAVPNWTGRLPIAGLPLAALFGLWIAGRLSMLFAIQTGPLLSAVIDAGFLLVLAAVTGREVLAGKNRNLPVVLLVCLFGLANAADHAGAAGLISDRLLPIRFAIGLVVMIVSLIGGRIVPSFTRNWMMKQKRREGLPGQPGRYDQAVLVLTGAALAVWAVAPAWRPGALLLAIAALAHVLRLARWRGWRVLRDPLVLILHIGYAWIPTGLAALAASGLSGWPSGSVAIHALTAGAMATMILAVMTRATLGHTGREPKAGAATVVIFALVTAGALLRVGAPVLLDDPFPGLELAAILWGGAFAMFAIVYGRYIFAPRPGETT